MVFHLIHVSWRPIDIEKTSWNYEWFLKKIQSKIIEHFSDSELIVFRPNMSQEPGFQIEEHTVRSSQEFRNSYEDLKITFPILEWMQRKNIVIYPEATYDMSNMVISNSLWLNDKSILLGGKFRNWCVHDTAQSIVSVFWDKIDSIIIESSLSYHVWEEIQNNFRKYYIPQITLNPDQIRDLNVRKEISAKPNSWWFKK